MSGAAKTFLVAGLAAFAVSLFLPVVSVGWGESSEVGYGFACLILSVSAIPLLLAGTLVPGVDPSWSSNMLTRLLLVLAVFPGISALLGVLSAQMWRFPTRRWVRILNRLHCVLAPIFLVPIAFSSRLDLHVGYAVWPVDIV